MDLTVSNPTLCGFDYNGAQLLRALSDPASLQYAAEPLGSLRARRAIARDYYAAKSIDIDPDRLLLTGSTSEAYSYLFRLLCDPGDQVLVPQPSYPLFDLLARLHDVELLHYPLHRHDGWSIDYTACEQLVTSRTRAVIVVHPNNPTGHLTHDEDRQRLQRFVAERGLALIADEVFLDYCLSGVPASFMHRESAALTFVLSGLSKVLALPQMKLAWTAVHGPRHLCDEAMHRLEFIADTFLPVSAPVANAAEDWFAGAGQIQGQIRRRIEENLNALDAVIQQEPLLARLPVEGGWSVVLRVPALLPDEQVALLLLEAGVLVHPGSFYGLPSSGYLVLSLLVPPGDYKSGMYQIARVIGRLSNGEPNCPT